MKLDKMNFALLVAYITSLRPEHDIDVYQLDTLTEINVEPVVIPYAPVEAVDDLLCYMTKADGYIHAIKAYRSLTGAGLKEAKTAIDRYRNVKGSAVKPEATSND